MPIYEYQCQACGHEFEALQKISDDLLRDCPSCKEAELKKKVSAAAFRLKGSGWYETDFKTANKKNLAGDGDSGAKPASSDSPTSKSEGKSDTKSDSKPDSKKASKSDGKKASNDSSGGNKKSA